MNLRIAPKWEKILRLIQIQCFCFETIKLGFCGGNGFLLLKIHWSDPDVNMKDFIAQKWWEKSLFALFILLIKQRLSMFSYQQIFRVIALHTACAHVLNSSFVTLVPLLNVQRRKGFLKKHTQIYALFRSLSTWLSDITRIKYMIGYINEMKV